MIDVEKIFEDANYLIAVTDPYAQLFADGAAERPVATALVTAIADAVTAELAELRRKLDDLRSDVMRTER